MSQETENNKCFVIMPSGKGNEYKGKREESSFIYIHIIQAAIKCFNKESEKKLIEDIEIENADPQSITDSIIKKLASAEVCIADLTGMNPNVLLELGIRYSLRNQNTILMIQEDEVVPFDLKPYRHIKYNPFKPDKAMESLVKALQSVYSNENYPHNSAENLVFRALPDLRVSIPSIGLISCNESKYESEEKLYESWGKWQDNAVKLRKILSGPLVDLHFNPNAVICVSHGRLNGLFTGSILTYGIFNKTKVLSLWGTRDSPNMFDNKVNRQMLHGLKTEAGKKKITLLLIDYKVESGETASQAIKFVTDVLGTNTDIVFCPMFCKSKEVFAQKKIILDGENFCFLQDYLPFNYKNRAGRGFDIVESYFYSIICVGESIPKHPLDWS